MKLELSLLELNKVYYAVSKLVESDRENLNVYGKNISSRTYLKSELNKSEALMSRIQNALYDEANRLDNLLLDARKAEQYDRERELLKSNSHYVSNEEADEDARDYSAFNDYANSMNEAQSEDRKLGNI
jgi:hypothetical protein